ncbi:unnamed protein product [Vicia faba]|uniref:Uncharacterized protein n=1 Tax=Vicia faba TaxID=3906 RepID=A0AAV0ZSA4_VICFA|nr:unnamed protein product [Vicia faba]
MECGVESQLRKMEPRRRLRVTQRRFDCHSCKIEKDEENSILMRRKETQICEPCPNKTPSFHLQSFFLFCLNFNNQQILSKVKELWKLGGLRWIPFGPLLTCLRIIVGLILLDLSC